MPEIEELTPEQEALIPKYHAEWIPVGLNHNPADWERGIQGVNGLYVHTNRREPFIIKARGHLAAQFVMCVIHHVFKHPITTKDSRWRELLKVKDGVLNRDAGIFVDNLPKEEVERVMRDVFNNYLDRAPVREAKKIDPIEKNPDLMEIHVARDIKRQATREFLPFITGRKSVTDEDVAKFENIRLDYTSTYFYGHGDAYWVSYYLYCRDVVGVEFTTENSNRLDAWAETTRSLGWFYPHESVCILTDRSLQLHMDDQNRLHHDSEPACLWRDGWRIYFSRNVRVPMYVFEKPELLNPKRIDEQDNQEVRRVMIERYTPERYLLESRATLLDDDPEWGKLYRKPIPDDEPIVMVSVINSTPEPDGTYKNYWLRVPPTMKKAKEAVAWTFGKSADEYQPDQQS